MPKRIDFAKERRIQGRALIAAVDESVSLLQPIAQQQGIDLRARLDEASARRSEKHHLLAKSLQESVVPLFRIDSGSRPDRIGSCVLVRLQSDLFAFTAAHVIREASSARLFAPSEGEGGKLLPLPSCTAYLGPSIGRDDFDVGVIALPPSHLGPFQKHVFLAETEIDQRNRPDGRGVDAFYFVLGYPSSLAKVTVSSTKRHIHQRSFQLATSPVEPGEYLKEQMSESDHILLDFDHNEIVLGKKKVTPPKLQGVSGGGIFHISRKTMCGPLVAIATQNRRNSRLIVGTRIKHFLEMVAEVKLRCGTSEDGRVRQ